MGSGNHNKLLPYTPNQWARGWVYSYSCLNRFLCSIKGQWLTWNKVKKHKTPLSIWETVFLINGHFHPHLRWLMEIYIILIWIIIYYFVWFSINKTVRESQGVSKIAIFEGDVKSLDAGCWIKTRGDRDALRSWKGWKTKCGWKERPFYEIDFSPDRLEIAL